MSQSNRSGKQACTNADLAIMVARVGEAIAADAIICITESSFDLTKTPCIIIEF